MFVTETGVAQEQLVTAWALLASGGRVNEPGGIGTLFYFNIHTSKAFTTSFRRRGFSQLLWADGLQRVAERDSVGFVVRDTCPVCV